MPELLIPSEDLQTADLETLREFADQVGVGYSNLDEESLRHKLVMEGTPVQ